MLVHQRFLGELKKSFHVLAFSLTFYVFTSNHENRKNHLTLKQLPMLKPKFIQKNVFIRPNANPTQAAVVHRYLYFILLSKKQIALMTTRIILYYIIIHGLIIRSRSMVASCFDALNSITSSPSSPSKTTTIVKLLLL